MNIFMLIFALLLIPVLAQSPMSYGEQRAREDRRPETLEARRRFLEHTTTLFNRNKAGLNLEHISLTLSQRMVAQRARGAASAMSEIPKELNQILWFIHHARTNRQGALNRLASLPALRGFDRRDINAALSHLANTRSISMNYWGYLGRTEQLPAFDLENRRLTYYARWIEREDRYSLVSRQHMWGLVIKGIIEAINYKPWYECVFGCED